MDKRFTFLKHQHNYFTHLHTYLAMITNDEILIGHVMHLEVRIRLKLIFLKFNICFGYGKWIMHMNIVVSFFVVNCNYTHRTLYLILKAESESDLNFCSPSLHSHFCHIVFSSSGKNAPASSLVCKSKPTPCEDISVHR